MASFRAFVRTAGALAARPRAMPGRRVIPRPGSGIGTSRNPASARPCFRPRDGTDAVREEDASNVSDVLAANLRQKVPRIRLSARLDLISDRLPRRLEELPIEIDASVMPLIEKIVEKHMDAAAVALRDRITEEFKTQQLTNPNVFTYVSTRMAFLADFLSTLGPLLVLGTLAYYLYFPDSYHAKMDAYRAKMDDLFEMVGNRVWYAISFGRIGETFQQRHERIIAERKAAKEAKDLKEKKELEQLLKKCKEDRRQPAPRRLTRGRGDDPSGSGSRWEHHYKGMASVGQKEWLKRH